MEDNYTAEHCTWLIDVVAHLVSEATKNALFGTTSTLNMSVVHSYMDGCYEPAIIEHFVKVLNEYGKAYTPED